MIFNGLNLAKLCIYTVKSLFIVKGGRIYYGLIVWVDDKKNEGYFSRMLSPLVSRALLMLAPRWGYMLTYSLLTGLFPFIMFTHQYNRALPYFNALSPTGLYANIMVINGAVGYDSS